MYAALILLLIQFEKFLILSAEQSFILHKTTSFRGFRNNIYGLFISIFTDIIDTICNSNYFVVVVTVGT